MVEPLLSPDQAAEMLGVLHRPRHHGASRMTRSAPLLLQWTIPETAFGDLRAALDRQEVASDGAL
jgi:hypothetical protein